VKILIMTNTYHPFTGGVPRSIDTFTTQYRRLGHTVKIVAPDFEGQEEEPDVLRVPAIQNFNGTDFSVRLPIPFYLSEFADGFAPDIIHSQHPFLLGGTALRMAVRRETPLVYTFHTFYDHYLHYLPGGGSVAMKRFVNALVAGYANLCDHVIAPSRSVAQELARRGVTTPVDVIPTGVDVTAIEAGDGPGFRAEHGIPSEAFVVGFVSRLAEEKNLDFLCDAVIAYMEGEPKAWFVVAGSGPQEENLKARFTGSPLASRFLLLGNLTGTELHGLYNALDVFAFASLSETQGLVVTEAMAAGVPVVALKASGVEDVVDDGRNGRLLEEHDPGVFARAIAEVASLDADAYRTLSGRARETAAGLSDEVCARRALAVYGAVRREYREEHEHETAWDEFVNVVTAEWNLLATIGAAAGAALTGAGEDEAATNEEALPQNEEAGGASGDANDARKVTTIR
jgi:1,2-diacylglycerol 3-alpha-glucosyltransferase